MISVRKVIRLRQVWLTAAIFLSVACSPTPSFTGKTPNSILVGDEAEQTLTTAEKPQAALTPAIAAQATQPARQVIDAFSASSLEASPLVELDGATAFSWAPDNDQIALVSPEQILYYDLARSTTVDQIEATNPGLLTVSQKHEVIAWVSEGNTVNVWKPGTKGLGQTQIENPAPVTGLTISPEGNSLAFSIYDGTLKTWDITNSQIIGQWQAPSWLSNLSYSPDSSRLGGVDLGSFTVYVLNAVSGEIERSLTWSETASPVLYGAYFSPDWQTLAWMARGEVQLMDFESEKFGPLLSHEDFVTALAWSPDSSLLATGSAATVEGSFTPVVQVWEAGSGKLLATLVQQAAVQSLSFSQDGTTLAVLDSDGQIRSWRAGR